jgi:Fe-S-cluster containining protein
MREIENFKKAILEDYPRMDEKSEFCFKCHKDVPCFNFCCGDVNIFLTSYDIIRLKNRLGITSGEFLSRYTISPFDENAQYPVLLLKMEDNERKSCPFVGEQGCTVYEDRPWPCRMYPLGLASPKTEQPDNSGDFFFLLKEETCKGHNEDNKITVEEWLSNQGIEEYNDFGNWFKEITLSDFFEKGNHIDPKRMEMFFTACYNIDKFRDFVFKSSFLEKIEIEDELVEQLKTDDIRLLKFAFDWIKFAIFGEPTMKIKSQALESSKKKMASDMNDIIPVPKWHAAYSGFSDEQKVIAQNTNWKFIEGATSPVELSIHITKMFADGMPKKKIIEELIKRGINEDVALAHVSLLENQLK